MPRDLDHPPRRFGTVTLLGAGPGDPELLTVKAVKALQRARLVLYDHLVGQEVLALLPPGCEQVYVGKESARHALPQREITSLLVRLAHEGRDVLRLKGGDGYIFGRGGEECDALREAAGPRLARSETVDNTTGGSEVNEARTSVGMFFGRGESALIGRIEARIARLLNWPIENGEGLQVLHYRPGAEYKPHYDYFDPDQPGTPSILARGGQRLATVVMYLSNPERGGGTVFPDLKLEVAPQKGHAVFFSYPVAHPASQSLHGGAPLLEGEKWVATKWLREGVFR